MGYSDLMHICFTNDEWINPNMDVPQTKKRALLKLRSQIFQLGNVTVKLATSTQPSAL